MFQTEPILWLQSLGSPPLTALLSVVTLLGYTPVYVTLLLVLAFALRLRPSLAVLGGVLLSGLLTEGFKDAVAYPRPDEVDDRVAKTFASTPIELHARGGATASGRRPLPDAIEAVRRRATGNYGFPSGHVAAATAFLLCTAYFFRSRRVLALGGAVDPADGAVADVPRPPLPGGRLGRLLDRRSLATALARAAVPGARRGGVPPARSSARRALLPVDAAEPGAAGADALAAAAAARSTSALLAGLVISYAFLLVTGLPLDDGTRRQRALRVVVAGLVFVAGLAATRGLLEVVGWQGGRLVPLGWSVLVSTATFAGTVAACRRLGLYARAS